MRTILRSATFLLLAVIATVPVMATSAADVTIPIVGHLTLPNDLTYRTELVLTNHRDIAQYVRIEIIDGGYSAPLSSFQIPPRATRFLPHGGFATSSGGLGNRIGAMRIITLKGFEGEPDPLGQIEANAFIVADRGRSGKNGSSRQEVAGIPSHEYFAEEALFHGVRHSEGTGAYTNVGVVNMHPTQTETFFVQFQFSDPVAVVVPPLTSRQMRIPGSGAGGRWVRVYPEWSMGDGQPLRTTPWVAYASTVDTVTGDAFSGMRVPAPPPTPQFDTIASDVTLPVAGYLDMPNDLVYRTEVMVTNHRDVEQAVVLELISDGAAFEFTMFRLEPRETKFLADGGFGRSSAPRNFIGALRIRAIESPEGSPDDEQRPVFVDDPLGQVQASAFIVGERGLGAKGATRQEVAGIPSNEYFAEEAVFLGVRHSEGTGAYTNVGIVNMHPTQTETFFVQFQYQEPVTVIVPPLSLRQMRIPGAGAGGRWVRVYPEWSIGEGAPTAPMPWVAYASTVDTLTGDAFSGMRAPADTRYVTP